MDIPHDLVLDIGTNTSCPIQFTNQCKSQIYLLNSARAQKTLIAQADLQSIYVRTKARPNCLIRCVHHLYKRSSQEGAVAPLWFNH